MSRKSFSPIVLSTIALVLAATPLQGQAERVSVTGAKVGPRLGTGTCQRRMRDERPGIGGRHGISVERDKLAVRSQKLEVLWLLTSHY